MRYRNLVQPISCVGVMFAGLMTAGCCLAQSELSPASGSHQLQSNPFANLNELPLFISDQRPDNAPGPANNNANQEAIEFTVTDRTDSLPPPPIIHPGDYRPVADSLSDEPNYFHLLEYQYQAEQPPKKIDPPQSLNDRAMSHVRAGDPLCQSRRASLTYDHQYKGYFVGGGVPAGMRRNPPGGEARYKNEGTWGVDYAPWYSRVALLWSHGRLYQGGIGQYEPDHKNRPFGQTYGRHTGN